MVVPTSSCGASFFVVAGVIVVNFVSIAAWMAEQLAAVEGLQPSPIHQCNMGGAGGGFVAVAVVAAAAAAAVDGGKRVPLAVAEMVK